MYIDFAFVPDTRKVKDKVFDLIRIEYKGECIAIFSEEDRKSGDVLSLEEQAKEYVRVYGYMAEYRRQWNNGDKINWTEDIRVSLE